MDHWPEFTGRLVRSADRHCHLSALLGPRRVRRYAVAALGLRAADGDQLEAVRAGLEAADDVRRDADDVPGFELAGGRWSELVLTVEPYGLQARGNGAATPARTRYGIDAWNADTRRGGALSFDDAIAYALDEPPVEGQPR